MLRNKVAVVTGCGRGIGRSIAETFVANGALVIACVRELDECLIRDIASKGVGGQVIGVPLDLENENSIKAAIKDIGSISGNKIDILVNNAGIATGNIFQMMPISELRRTFEVNFFGQLLFTQGLARFMMRHRSGSIINIGSTASDIPDSGTLAYGASKAAFIRASRSMATEFGVAGIRVNVISPGVTRTDMFHQMTPAARDRLIASSSLKRPADTSDIANAALFFAGDLSSFVTGQVLRVDGGML